jgi:hypothetical protein
MLYIPEPIRALKRKLLRKSDGERFLRERYHRVHGKRLDTDNPKTFTEKLYRRMIETNRGEHPDLTTLSDKVLVREFIKRRAGDQFLTKLHWIGPHPSKIPFDDLPEKCMAKTNHGCGRNIVLTPDINRQEAVSQLEEWLKENYYWPLREAQYYKIKPQVLIEEFLDDGYSDGPLDYKFWCINGEPELLQVDNRSHDISSYFDRDWKPLDITTRPTARVFQAPRPERLDEMIGLARSLSRGFEFVRVDMYSVHGKPIAGEMTFSPGAGTFKFSPERWDLHFGEKWI